MDEKLKMVIENQKKMSINDFLNQREMKLENRNTVLQSKSTCYLKVLQLGYERIEFQ